ncbi:hypothetical protein WSM22_37510 [Cytophagales bacterium WSM2-2]|nr:hypothetical protein WSM22_37510 [Cytophagales bacterium WSM2-2]
MVSILLKKFSIDPVKISVAADGGTIAFELLDAEGETHQFFIDRRIRSDTRDHLYSGQYPGSKDSIYLGMNEGILNELEKIMSAR